MVVPTATVISSSVGLVTTNALLVIHFRKQARALFEQRRSPLADFPLLNLPHRAEKVGTPVGMAFPIR